MKTTLLAICFLFLTATVAVMAQAPSVEVTTEFGVWSVEYEKEVIPLSETETWTLETVSLERKDAKGKVYLDLSFSPEMQLFMFAHEKHVLNGEDEDYCRLIMGQDIKKKLEVMFLNPAFRQSIIKGELLEAAEEYLKTPGTSLIDAEWKQIAARVEAAVKTEFEVEVEPFIRQTIVIDTSADEIALAGGVAAWLYPNVIDPGKLRLFMASIQTLAKTAIRELKESQKLSESTQKQLDALVGLMPEQYGMTR